MISYFNNDQKYEYSLFDKIHASNKEDWKFLKKTKFNVFSIIGFKEYFKIYRHLPIY